MSTLQGQYEWDYLDFHGRYHLNSIANRLDPIPGSQLIKEKLRENRINNKEEEYKRKDENNQIVIQRKLQLIEFQNKNKFDTSINLHQTKGTNYFNNKQTQFKNEEKLEECENTNIISNEKFKQLCYDCVCKLDSYAFERLLIKSPAVVHYRSELLGHTLLHYCASQYKLSQLNILLKYGGNPNTNDSVGNKPLHSIFQPKSVRSSSGHNSDDPALQIQLLTALVTSGADINALNSYKQTCLHLAAKYTHTSVIKAILQFNVSIDIHDIYDLTGEDYALQAHHYETVLLLKNWAGVRIMGAYEDLRYTWQDKLNADNHAITSNNSKTISDNNINHTSIHSNDNSSSTNTYQPLTINRPPLSNSLSATQLKEAETFNRLHRSYTHLLPPTTTTTTYTNSSSNGSYTKFDTNKYNNMGIAFRSQLRAQELLEEGRRVVVATGSTSTRSTTDSSKSNSITSHTKKAPTAVVSLYDTTTTTTTTNNNNNNNTTNTPTTTTALTVTRCNKTRNLYLPHDALPEAVKFDHIHAKVAELNERRARFEAQKLQSPSLVKTSSSSPTAASVPTISSHKTSSKQPIGASHNHRNSDPPLKASSTNKQVDNKTKNHTNSTPTITGPTRLVKYQNYSWENT